MTFIFLLLNLLSAENISALVSSLNKFSFESLQYINKNNKNENIVFSPYSAFACVSMAAPLFTSETRLEILKSLQMNELFNDTQLLTELKRLISAESTEHFASSNRVWANINFNFDESTFKQHNDILGIPVERVDFPQPGCDKINEEVRTVTHGMIDKLVEESDLPKSTAIALLNAVYFQNSWEQNFYLMSKNDELNFINANGEKIHVDFMKSFDRHLPYAENDKYQIISLPYLDHYDFVAILPRNNSNANDFEMKDLSYDDFTNLLNQMSTESVNVIMPKFTIEQKLPLNQLFGSLGMNRAFSSAAQCLDSSVKYSIDSILQKAKIEFHENGTVAAAATCIMMRALSLSPEEPYVFNANHPFMYFIRNKDTGSILFEGFFKGSN